MRFLIEVPHEGTKQSCDLAVKTFLQTGSHFMTNAEWGCPDNEHKAWIIVDMESKDDARLLVPPGYRNAAKITQLARFSMDNADQSISEHHA